MNPPSLIGHLLELVQKTDTLREPADRIAADFFRQRKYLGSHDRRFLSDALFGIIRHRRLLEALLEEYILEHEEAAPLDTSRVRYLPLALIYALTTPEEHPHIPWYLSFWKSYFPKINPQDFLDWIHEHLSLDFLPEGEIVRLGVRYSFQDWMVSAWSRELPSETESLLRALNSPAATTLRVNTLRVTREGCRQRLESEGISTACAQYSPSGLVAAKRFSARSSPAFKEGWFELQDEGSQLLSLIPGVKPGSRVVDACAGAGGKSLHLAELMRNEGEILAADVDPRRLEELRERAKRAGVAIIRTALRRDIRWEEMSAHADLVLVDAPCSGTGTIRRNPGLKWSVAEETVKQYAARQLDILESSSGAVKAGGMLAYATCSLFREENEDVVGEFLRRNPGFRTAGAGASGFDTSPLGIQPPFMSFYPHRYGGDGYFLALLTRAG
jgi:16S rRNA (cytosine967-C5)-methyltransferase